MPRLWNHARLLAAVVCAAALLAAAPSAQAQCNNCNNANCRSISDGQPDLFPQYYVPGNCGGVPAQLYVSPLPVPPGVGHTYFTYQPFMPHEMLYHHNRTYYSYYNNGRGLNRTSVHWTSLPFSRATRHVVNSLRIPR